MRERRTLQPTQIESYRRALLAKRADVLAGLGRKFDVNAELGRIAEDDAAPVIHDEYISLSLNRLEHQQRKLVEDALDRVAAGDYGRCLACESPIPPKRLKAVPWARFCIQCQTRESEASAGAAWAF
jgi:DnaK suppressor protein